MARACGLLVFGFASLLCQVSSLHRPQATLLAEHEEARNSTARLKRLHTTYPISFYGGFPSFLRNLLPAAITGENSKKAKKAKKSQWADVSMTRQAKTISSDAKVQNTDDSQSGPPIVMPKVNPKAEIQRRVVFYDHSGHAGIDDRSYVLHRLLSFSKKLNAVLAFPDPYHSLGRAHGATSAESWRDYFFIDGPLMKPDEVRCPPNVPEVKITTHKAVIGESHLADMRNASRPLCLRIQVGYFQIDQKSEVFKMIEQSCKKKSKDRVKMKTSTKVADLMRKVVEEKPQLDGEFHAIHVRKNLNDKSLAMDPNCNSVSHSLEKMEQQVTEHPDHAAHPWLLMSDGNESFFQEIVDAARLKSMNVVTEKELTTLTNLKDNFMRFLVLECFFRSSFLTVSTFKLQGLMCESPRSWRPNTRFLCTLPPTEAELEMEKTVPLKKK